MPKLKLLIITFFESIWYRKSAPFWAILCFKPLELLYCYLSERRRKITKPIKHPIPIIVIGNITLGGTGKTPLLIHLVELLKNKGYQPAVISRGYAAQQEIQQPLLLTSNTSTSEAGDEPVLIYQRTQVPVCVYPKRNLAIQTLLANYSQCNVILSDDGLQHYSMHRDIEIVVIDGMRLLGNQQCLPLGPLRESSERLNTVDFIITNGPSSFKSSNTKAFNMHPQGEVLYSLGRREEKRYLKDFAYQTVNVLTGIGNPERFLLLLKKAHITPLLKRFPDHHVFEQSDFTLDNNYPILITEKDAVKCQSFKLTHVWYLPITVKVDSPFEELLLQRLQEVSTRCKSNY